MSGHDLILGLGASGESCARYLYRAGRAIKINDSRPRPVRWSALRERAPGIEFHLGAFDQSLVDDATRLVASPGIPMNNSVIARAGELGVPIVSDIDLFVEQCGAPIAAITGSNGKSTVTCWLESVLSGAGRRCRAGGNVGTPALDLLDTPDLDAVVLELSSFQLERSGNLPLRTAALLNVSADHLDHHGSFAAYQQAKTRVFAAADHAVVLRSLRHLVPNHVNAVTTIGLDAPAEGHYGRVEHNGEFWLARGDERLLPVSELALVQAHDHLNALAVLALAERLGVHWPAARDGLVAFAGLAHRGQVVRRRAGITWINDSKATNVGATVAAIQSAIGPLVLIAGGDAKGGDLAPLATALTGRARAAIVLGKDGPALANAISSVCPVHTVDRLDDAVERAAVLARAGDTVLLSPACASLDMFTNYEARGQAFIDAVEALT
ncbi:MAG: UDP-N-acetylmuramoyl-L-alanine--D-glutamate ligase [Pseudomonadota bacterium]